MDNNRGFNNQGFNPQGQGFNPQGFLQSQQPQSGFDEIGQTMPVGQQGGKTMPVQTQVNGQFAGQQFSQTYNQPNNYAFSQPNNQAAPTQVYNGQPVGGFAGGGYS